MVAEIELLESTDLTALDFCLWGWMQTEVDQRRLDAQDELLAPILCDLSS
jgi:hypothetical protein